MKLGGFYLFNSFLLLFFLDHSLFNNNQLYILTVLWKTVYFLNDTQYNIIFFLICFFLLLNFYSTFKVLFFILLWFYIKSDLINYVEFSKISWSINTNLTNGLCLIHPILVYFVYVYFLFLIFCKFDLNYYWIYKKLKIRILSTNLLALILGAWWAQQELNWGGWWNWDFVELILLIFFLKLLIMFHIRSFKIIILSYVFNYIFLIYLFLFFIFVRWNLLNSIHSFNTTNFFEKYYSYIITVIIYVFSLYIFITIRYYFNYNNFINFSKNFTYLHYISLLFNIIIYFIIFFFSYNVYLALNSEDDISELIKFLKFLFVYLIVILFTNKKKTNIFFSIVLMLVSKTFLIYIININYLNLTFNNRIKLKLKLIHCLILIFCFLVMLTPDNFFIYYSIYSDIILNSVNSIRNFFITEFNAKKALIYFVNSVKLGFSELFDQIYFFNISCNFCSSTFISNASYDLPAFYNFVLVLLWYFALTCFYLIYSSRDLYVYQLIY